jgi:hypothetical protein
VKLLAKPLALPTALAQPVGKAGRVLQGKPIFANSLPKAGGKAGKAVEESPALPTALAYAVGKAGNPPLFFSFLAFNSHIKSTHQHMNQNTTYISTI